LNTFQDAVRLIRVGEFKMELLHAANSGQALHLPDSRLDIARVGRALYGLDSGPAYPLPPDFSPALAWKTTVAQVKRMQGRMLISKEGIPMPTKPRTVAVLPLGYTEGLRPAWQQVLIHGQRVPVVGGVGSYQTLADIQGLDDVRIGDEVVLIGRQGEAVIRAEEGAAWLGVEVDELLSLLLARTPQVKV
jgi:alanine racemase